MKEYLPLATLLRLLAVLVLAMGPHALTLPVWETLVIGALIGWRGLCALRQWPMPRTWLRLLLTVAAFVGISAYYGRISGQVPGTALLCVMTALKLLELRARRDVMVMLFLMYFLLLTHFLFSQELWTVLYLLASTIATTALMIECQHLGALPPRQTLRRAASMVAQALPLMLLMFVLFPRIPGPLWGLPADAGAQRSGLGDSMSPGDISTLIRSEEVAFRVLFTDTAPPSERRYWRGPVFDRFDGRSWEKALTSLDPILPGQLQTRGEPIRYRVTLEPHRMFWMFGMDMPDAGALPPSSLLSRDAELLSGKPVKERIEYALTSRPDFRLDLELPELLHRRNRRLPEGYNPRAVALAQSWRQQGLDDAAIAEAALSYFRREHFVYTLQPPLLGRNSVDEFLFETRRGFCEHYASAFAVLMRAAGIPARIVTGYVGGELNELSGYYVIRQSDAHAWTEIWLPDRGWWRIDPTAAVPPERVEAGVAGAAAALQDLGQELSLRIRMKHYLELRWDWANTYWNSWVLAYGPELQQSFLSRFGIRDYQGMVLALTILGSGLLGVVGLLMLRQFAPARSEDAVLRIWQRLQQRLAKAGLPAAPGEGPQDYLQRLAAQRPESAAALEEITALYLEQRYLAEPDPAGLARLEAAVRAFRI